MILAATAQPSPKGWLCAGTYIVLAILVPILFLLRLLKDGQVSDLDITRRQERSAPFMTAWVGAIGACGCLYAYNAPTLLARFALAHTLVMSLILLITFYWKISVHAAGIASVAVLSFAMPELQKLALALIVLVGWSRLYLGRHTFMQVLAGGLLGMGMFVLLLPTP